MAFKLQEGSMCLLRRTLYALIHSGNTSFIIEISWMMVVNSSAGSSTHSNVTQADAHFVAETDFTADFMWQDGPEVQIQRPTKTFIHVIHRMCLTCVCVLNKICHAY